MNLFMKYMKGVFQAIFAYELEYIDLLRYIDQYEDIQ